MLMLPSKFAFGVALPAVLLRRGHVRRRVVRVPAGLRGQQLLDLRRLPLL